MNTKFVIIVLYILLFTKSAFATPVLQINGSGRLTGASNVEVAGDLYNVEFKAGSFISVFGGAGSLDVTTLAEAQKFSQALSDLVIVDNQHGLFDTNPLLTNGCISTIRCFINTPYAYLSQYVQSSYFANYYAESADAIGSGSLQANYNVSQSSYHSIWADWELVPPNNTVPEPSILMLLITALLGVGMSRNSGID